MQTIASVSMIFFLWGTVIFLFGYTIFRICLFPLLILFFMIPVPAQIIATLTIPLQLIVTRASVWLASMIGIPIYHEGNVINLPQGTFQVVQACSGLRSSMTMLTLGAVLAYLTLRSNMLRVILFSIAIPIAIAVNILRVFVLVAVFYFLEIDLSRGTIHTILGLAVFGMAFGLFLLAGKGLALCER
jgi:exosortase